MKIVEAIKKRVSKQKSYQENDMKIRVETENDRLFMEDGKIKAVVKNKEYLFDISDIEQVVLLTTDLGPAYDDMCLAIRIDKETAIFIMSEHPSYETFLFEQLGKAIQIDYQAIIKASTCTDNNVFVLYKR